MRSIDDLKRWKEKYNLTLTPIVKGTKKPGVKESDKWEPFDRWSYDVLLKSEKLGFFQKPSGVFTLDFDDKKYVAHKFLRLFPETFTDGKFLDETIGSFVATHLTYKVNGQGALDFKYPPRAKGKDDGLLLETLFNKQTIFTGGDRKAIEKPIASVDIKYLEKLCKLTCFFTELFKAYDVGEGGRDELHLRLTGCLARLDAEEYPTEHMDRDWETCELT